jgi:hypothetical protein
MKPRIDAQAMEQLATELLNAVCSVPGVAPSSGAVVALSDVIKQTLGRSLQVCGIPDSDVPSVAKVTMALESHYTRDGTVWVLAPLHVRFGGSSISRCHPGFEGFIRAAKVDDVHVYNDNPSFFGFPANSVVVGETEFDAAELMEMLEYCQENGNKYDTVEADVPLTEELLRYFEVSLQFARP